MELSKLQCDFWSNKRERAPPKKPNPAWKSHNSNPKSDILFSEKELFYMRNSIYSLRIDNECFGPVMIAIGCRPYYAFKDGVRQSTVEGYQYTIVLPKLGYQQINVKVPGECKLEITEGKEAHVKFDGLLVRPYVNRDAMTLALTATASAVHADGKAD